jgi:predicted ATP-dependent endonuclease of OLD family
MPISQISCVGYRSLEDATLPLEPPTAMVGPNDSGKTLLLRALKKGLMLED